MSVWDDRSSMKVRDDDWYQAEGGVKSTGKEPAEEEEVEEEEPMYKKKKWRTTGLERQIRQIFQEHKRRIS